MSQPLDVALAEHAHAPYGGTLSHFDASDLDALSTNDAWGHLGQSHHAPRFKSTLVTFETHVDGVGVGDIICEQRRVALPDESLS